MPTPMVLIHGGGGDHRTWDPLLPHLRDRQVLAVDLPGRGRHPRPFADVTFAACAASVATDVDEAGFDEIVLVGHSMAGCSIPAIAGCLGERVRHAVFVACTVPPDGQSAYDTVDPEIKAAIEAEHGRPTPDMAPAPMDPELAKAVFGNDLDEEQWAWALERMIPEAPGLTLEPVHLEPLWAVPRRSWVRTTLDIILPPENQLRFAANARVDSVTDLEAGHLCTVSQPAALAAILADLLTD
jgi:pimeloyl-ACP methyl ester carboxylesterase